MVLDSREYELILYGATGYTGKLCAEYITTYLPTNLKWAIAGRNADKLQAVVEELKTLNPDRNAPGIEVAAHQKDDLHTLVKKARVIVTTVGPFSKMGEVMVEACASNGTHYLDSTGESPWFRDMISKYHETARKNNAIIIPQCGIESVPADLTTYAVCKHIKSKYSLPTRLVSCILYDAKAGASGGTLSSVLSVFETYSISYLRQSMQPFSMCPIPRNAADTPPNARQTIIELLLGVNHHPEVGVLTDSPQGAVDRNIVNRSWGLLAGLPQPNSFYGPRFHFRERMRSDSILKGALFHYALLFAGAWLILPPVRWILRKFVFLSPGSGPDLKQAAKTDFVEYRTIGESDSDEVKTARATLRFKGSLYMATAVFISEAAMVLARPEEPNGQPCEARKLGGGLLTTACLGDEYLERLKDAHNVTLNIE